MTQIFDIPSDFDQRPPMYRPDAHQVHPQVWVGGDVHHNSFIAAAQFRGMDALGIEAIIDVRQEHNDKALAAMAAPDIAYHHIPTDDHGGMLEVDWWLDVIQAARPHIEAGETIFVHCHMGANRGPSAAFAILTELLGVEFKAAYDQIVDTRPAAWAIYAKQWVDMVAETTEIAEDFARHFDAKYDYDALVDTIGLVRQKEWQGQYRIELVEVK